jgi:tetratricopeptide (TPR) repeat protein
MLLPCQRRRAGVAVLAVGFALLLAHGHAAPPARSKERDRPLDQPPELLSLSPDQERQAAAVAHFATAISLELNSGLEAALPEYELALQLDPRNLGLAIRLARVSLSKRDFAAAIQRLQAASKSVPSAPEPWLWLGVTHRAAEEIPAAIADLKQALKLDPQFFAALRELVQIQLKADDTAAVPGLLEQAAKLASTDPDYWLGLGDLYIAVPKEKPSLAEKLDRTKARQCYEKARALAPRNPDVLLRLAETYVEAGDFPAAADAYSQLAKLRTDLPGLQERLAYIYLEAKQPEKAIAIFQDAVKRDPLRYETYNALAATQEETGKDEAAIASYQQSLVLNPNQIEVYLHLTGLHLKRKKPDDAMQLLATAKTKFPTRYQIPYLTGLVYSEQKEYAKAVVAFADAESLGRDATDDEFKPTSAFYFSYGAACERSGATDKAVTLFRKSLEVDPKNHTTANYLGYMWADKGQNLEEALSLIRTAVAGDADNGAYLDSLGWVLFKLGRTEEALPHLRRAAELVKDDAVVYDHLAEVLLKLGKRDEAIAALKKAVELDGSNKDLAEKLKRLNGN